VSEHVEARFEPNSGDRAIVWRAPGRVNLIGEHTDYNDGFIMPVALQFATDVAVTPRDDRLLRVRTTLGDQGGEFDLDAPSAPRGDWTDYVFGVAVVLEASGRRLRGADLAISSTVPIGAGLSSSAALEVAVAGALTAIAGHEIAPVELALLCQKAENEFVGMRCGIMDQYIAARGVAGHALMIDCRSLEARAVPIDPKARIVVANSMVHHRLADGGDYNARRRSCEVGVAALDRALGPIRALRDVGPTELEAHAHLLDDVTFRRCRHVVTENERVVAAAEALGVGDLSLFGTLMNASHLSMRDDYEISCAEIDVLVDIAQGLPGVFGSRMTGGGFGGSTVSLVATEAVDEVVVRLAAAYERATGIRPTIFACSPGAGAGRVAEGGL
jgi:galactokinase